MSSALTWFIIILTLGNILGCLWLIRWSAKHRPGDPSEGDVMGHVWDGDLEEYNNPLPRWWLWLFYITIAFGIVYLLLYPGFGAFAGYLGWSQEQRYEEEIAKADEKYGPIFAAYAEQSIPELAESQEARDAGRRLFLTYCATCHGSDAGGAKGFPNLKDDAWLYGGDPQAIKVSILQGRNGVMPPMAAAVGGDEGVVQVAHYVRSLAGLEHDADQAEQGKTKFAACAACHGAEAKGNTALGAPNLTDSAWLYGSDMESIQTSIAQGRSGKMPAHEQFLGEDKVHLLTAYVYSLSR